MVRNRLANSLNMAMGKKSGISKSQKMERLAPRKPMIKLTFDAQLNRLGQSTSQKSVISRRNKPIPPINPITRVWTSSLCPEPWSPFCKISTARKTSESQPAVADTASGWAFSCLTSSSPVPTY